MANGERVGEGDGWERGTEGPAAGEEAREGGAVTCREPVRAPAALGVPASSLPVRCGPTRRVTPAGAPRLERDVRVWGRRLRDGQRHASWVAGRRAVHGSAISADPRAHRDRADRAVLTDWPVRVQCQ